MVLISAFYVDAQEGCVRAAPVSILKKSVFPGKTFSLTENKENPAEKIGTEKAKISGAVDLTIINSGCENYSLSFRFSIKQINRKITDTKFWYGKTVGLMNSVKKGIRSQDISLINRGLKAIVSYQKRTVKPEYENEISFGGSEIRDVVILHKVKKMGKKQIVEISYGVGPL